MGDHISPAAAGHEAPDAMNHESNQRRQCKDIEQATKRQARDATVNEYRDCTGAQNPKQPNTNAVIHSFAGNHMVHGHEDGHDCATDDSHANRDRNQQVYV